MSRWVNEIQWNTQERWERTKVHTRVTVHDHCFMADRLHIDVYVAAQKMFRLRIISVAEHLLNENLAPSCCDNHPKKRAQQESERQKPGSRGRTQRTLITF